MPLVSLPLVRGVGLHARVCQLLQLARALHTEVTRDPKYSVLTDEDVTFFRGLLGDKGVVTDPDALEPYNRDWLGKYHGRSRLALRPSSTQQVSQVLKFCSQRRLAVVPQGGNTGLVGGSVPVFDEVILSLSSMNQIMSVDAASGVLVCQAGCILQTLEAAAAQQGLTVPLDLGAKGSCQIGGNVSTNAGGLRLLRYGSLHGSVLGLEAVLADGRVLNLLKTLRKDNTGFDLKQLFIGSEGTLGVVTAISIQCAPLPASVQLAFLAAPSFDAVCALLALARRRLGEVLSAAEFLDAGSMDLVTGHLEGVRNPLGGAGGGGVTAPFYVLLETSGSNQEHDSEKLQAFLQDAMDSGLVEDGTLAESGAQAASIWRVREGITESLTRRGATYKYDLSLPQASMYQLVQELRQRIADSAAFPDALVVGYGHLGDGNLHLNVSNPGAYDERLLGLIEPYVYEWTAARGGSISAEHGLGAMKAGAIGYSQPPEAVALMGQLKALLDPGRVLNPYKVLPGAALDAAYGAAADGATSSGGRA